MTPFKTNAQFRGALQRRGPVRPMQPMKSMSNDKPSEPRGPLVLQPQGMQQAPQQSMGNPKGAQEPMRPQGMAAQGVDAMKATGGSMQMPGGVPQAPVVSPSVAPQVRDVRSEFDQARAALESKPEVAALAALSNQMATMDPSSPQLADLRAKMEQAKGMLTQSPEYQRTLAAAQMLQQRAADEAAFQNGYAAR